MSTHYRDLRRSEAPKVKEKLSETRLKLGTKYCVNSLVGRKGEGGEGLPVMKGGEEFLMALKSNERLSFSLTHSFAASFSVFLVTPPSPLDSSFSLIDEPPATTDRSFQLSIHPCFLPVCSTVNYIPVNFFPSSSSEQTIETRRECTFGIVVFFFFFYHFGFQSDNFFIREKTLCFVLFFKTIDTFYSSGKIGGIDFRSITFEIFVLDAP